MFLKRLREIFSQDTNGENLLVQVFEESSEELVPKSEIINCLEKGG